MDWTIVNKSFGLCPSRDCAVREGCLRWTAAQLLPEKTRQWLYLNHRLWQSAGAEGCEAFCTAEPQRVARGFKRALGDIPLKHRPSVYEDVCRALRTGRNHYYEMRRGQRALSPREQEVIASVLVRYGAREPVVFDAYEQALLWED